MRSRREVLRDGGALAGGLAVSGIIGQRAWAAPPAEDAFSWGPLVADPKRILDLPEGFTYTILAVRNQVMTDGIRRPGNPDLNVAFPAGNGRTMLVTCHELTIADALSDFFNTFNPAKQRPIVRRPGDRPTSVAGASAMLIDEDLTVHEMRLVASDMMGNCSGGGTPWGTVLSGEENHQWFEHPEGGYGYGWVYEIDPITATKTRLEGLGRFSHESAVVDASTGYVYLTEDDRPACLYRFVPDDPDPGRLGEGGRLEAYRSVPAPGWVEVDDPAPQNLWIDIIPGAADDVAAFLDRFGAKNYARTARQAIAKGAHSFARLEGARIHDGKLWFTETAVHGGRVWTLDLTSDALTVVVEGGRTHSSAVTMPDNIAIHPSSDTVFICEDKDSDAFWQSGANRIVAMTPSGEVTPFARTWDEREPTGVEWRADGRVLFLNLMDDLGATMAITGPFPF